VRYQQGTGHGAGMRRHGWTAWVTHAMEIGHRQCVDEGVGMVWACTAVDEGTRVHETWMMAQARC